MYKIGDYVVYKRDVCKVVDYKKNHIRNMDYYYLVPVFDKTLKIDIPVDNDNLGDVLYALEVDNIIDNIINIDIIDILDKMLEGEYKRLLHEGGYEGLIKIIKTTYLRNNDRINNKRKISEKDNEYFKLAERYLYSEFSVALGISYDEAKEYVINKVREMENMKN